MLSRGTKGRRDSRPPRFCDLAKPRAGFARFKFEKMSSVEIASSRAPDTFPTTAAEFLARFFPPRSGKRPKEGLRVLLRRRQYRPARRHRFISRAVTWPRGRASRACAGKYLHVRARHACIVCHTCMRRRMRHANDMPDRWSINNNWHVLFMRCFSEDSLPLNIKQISFWIDRWYKGSVVFLRNSVDLRTKLGTTRDNLK